MEEHLGAIRDWLANNERKMSELSTELNRLRDSEQNYRDRIKNFEAQCAAAVNREHELGRRLAEIRKEIEKKSQMIIALRESSRRTEKQLIQKEEKLAHHLERQSSEKAAWKKEYQKIQNAKNADHQLIRTLRSELKEEKTQSAYWKQRAASGEKFAKLRPIVTELEAEKRSLLKQVEAQKATINGLSTAAEKAANQLAETQKSEQQLKKKVHQVTQDYQRVTSTYIVEKSNLEGQVEAQKEELEILRQKLTKTIQESRLKIESIENDYKAEISRLESGFQQEVESFLLKVDEKKRVIEGQKQIESDFTQTIADLRGTVKSLHAQLYEAQKQQHSFNAEIAAFESGSPDQRLKAAIAENIQNKQLLAESRSLNEASAQKLQSASSEAENLRTRNKELELRQSAFETRYEDLRSNLERVERGISTKEQVWEARVARLQQNLDTSYRELAVSMALNEERSARGASGRTSPKTSLEASANQYIEGRDDEDVEYLKEKLRYLAGELRQERAENQSIHRKMDDLKLELSAQESSVKRPKPPLHVSKKLNPEFKPADSADEVPQISEIRRLRT